MVQHVSMQRIEFTAHGLIQLLPGEHRVMVLEEAALHGQDCTVGPDGVDIAGERGRLEATTQRLTWIESGSRGGDPKRSCSLPIVALESASMSTGMFTAINIAPKLKIMVKVDRQGTPSRTSTETKKLTITGSRSVVHQFQESLSQLIERASKKPVDDLPSADASAVEQLTVMGFNRSRANCALLCTANDLSAAVQWLSERSHQSNAELKELALQHIQQQKAQTTDVLTEQLKDMGYTLAAIQAARAATDSQNAAVIVEWLHTHPEADNEQLAPATMYPEPEYGFHADASTTVSHPIYGQESSSAVPLYPPVATASAPPAYPEPDMLSVRNPYAQYYSGGSYGAVQQTTSAPQLQMQSSRPAGMEGLVAAQRAKASRIGADLKAGFRDLQALRESGEKLAHLASDLSARMAAGQSGQSLDAGMARELIELGIISPVTKQSAGKQYHEQLSRQLAEFLEKQLRREKGMMVLHDVYCLFNRARGMELVSPDDLRTAAELFESLKLPVSLRVFPSGVAVVQDQTWSDDEVCSAILDVINKEDASTVDPHLGRALSCTQYAVEASVPVAVATEQLLLAERKGFLCRDDGASGLFFYRNWFVEV